MVDLHVLRSGLATDNPPLGGWFDEPLPGSLVIQPPLQRSAFCQKSPFFWQTAFQLTFGGTMKKRTLKVWSVSILSAVLVLLLIVCGACWMFLRGSLARLDGTVKVAGLHVQVTVARDARGVPLISGAERNDVAYATGYVHAQERFFQMDLLRRVGAGELAELFGARALPLDRARRLHRFRARAEQMLTTMPAAERRLLERYVAGVNDGLNALAARPFEYALVGATPRPWSAADSLLVVCAMYFDLQDKQLPRELARGWLREHSDAAQRAFLLPAASQWDATFDGSGAAPEAPIPATAPPWWGQPKRVGAPARLASNGFVDAVGSNNWALAGARSSDGAAIVADDMHLGLGLPNIWYRLALQFTDAQGKPRRVVGVSLPGAMPTVVVGSNGHVAWGYTNSYGDYVDLVTMESDPARPGQVRTPAGWESPVAHAETILVKGQGAEPLVVRETSVGPLIEVGAKVYAMHWVAHTAGALNANPARLETTDTLADALDVANTLGIPAQNFVAGDDKGNIGWTIAGALPRRTQAGDGATFPIPADGSVQSFDGNLAPARYPRVVNPATGQLSSANSRQLMGEGAQLIGDGGFDLGARNKQVHDALLALGDRADLAGVHAVGLDDRALFMSAWRARALKVLDAAALKDQPLRAQFLAQLNEGWTGHASVDSTGYRLARQFMWSLHDMFYERANSELAALDEKASMALVSSRWPVVLDRLLDAEPAGWLPPGHASWRALQLAALDRAIGELTGDGNTLAAATWGARNTANIAHPISTALPLLKPWLSAPADQLAGDANMPRVAGPKFGQSERLTVSPGKEAQGVFNMPGGQSGHPLSPYFLSGHAEWAKGQSTPLLPGPALHTLTFVK
jgi:penicillin amidase